MTDLLSDKLLTVNKVAELLDVSPWTIRDWFRSGRLPAIRLGDTAKSPVRIKASDVEKLLIPVVPRTVTGT